MKSFIYVLTVSSLMICNPVFLLAKHNYTDTDNALTVEEQVQLEIPLLEDAAETFNLAKRLENGNYQIRAGAGGALALMAYTLLQLQKADPSAMKILDPRQLQYFGRIENPNTLRHLRLLRKALRDAVITLKSDSPSSSIRSIVLNGLENNDEAKAVAYRGSANNLNVSSLDRNIHNLDEFDDRIIIQPEGRAPVLLTSEVTPSGATVTIGSTGEAPVFARRSATFLTPTNPNHTNYFNDTLTRTIKTSPKMSRHLIPCLAVGFALASLFLQTMLRLLKMK